MIPIKLSLEGLYSYQERQIIDFTDLTSGGLFGIFGATGSGKSAILEAISFALYGETERLNSRENRAYNMMNLKSKRSYIDFEFLNHQNIAFKVTREFARNSKNFKDVKPKNTQFYQQKNGVWEPLDIENAASILGLNYKNFKRTIIIPQGQFKEFIELGSTERTQMMQEIFNLDAYDLTDKTNVLLNENKSALDQLEGKLTGFELINEEKITLLRVKFEEETKQTKELDLKFKNSNEAFKRAEILHREARLLSLNEENLAKLETKKEDFIHRQKQLLEFEKIQDQFASLIAEEESLTKDFDQQEQKFDLVKKDIVQCEAALEKANDTIQSLKEDYEGIEQTKAEILDLGTLLKLKEVIKTIDECNSRLEKGEKYKNEKTEEKKSFTEQIDDSTKRISNLKKQQLNASLVLNLSEWYQKKTNLAEQIEEKIVSKKDYVESMDVLNGKLQEMGLDEETFAHVIGKELEESNSRVDDCDRREKQLLIDQKLSEFADALHDGSSCPLCGSTDHPHVLSGIDVTDALTKLATEKLANAKNLLEINQRKADAERFVTDKKHHYNELQKVEKRIDELKNLEKELVKQFVWEGFDANDRHGFMQKKAESDRLNTEIDKLENDLALKQAALKKVENDFEKYNQAIRKIENENSVNQGSKASLESSIKQLNLENYAAKSIDEIELLRKEKLANTLDVEKKYKQAERLLNETKLSQVKFTTQREEIVKHLESLKERIEKVNDEIKARLVVTNLSSVEKVKIVLAKQLDAASEREEIKQFQIDLQVLNQSINALKEKLKDFDANPEAFASLESELKESSDKLELAKANLTRVSDELKRAKAAYDEKKELLKIGETLKNRAENLNKLRNLFSGGKFVKYVSSIYLRQLCDYANVRFTRMTRNQLSLSLSDTLDFEVIDYLNEGQSRNVKTLSGGQIFQASLSLALALAESVQVKSNTEQHFFFIDEGFGTQDSEAVNLVYETLLHLNKENKVVGIISHVDELKERIPMSLSVVKDPDRGSLLSIN